ncbi:MAG: T9SS type A sorting domain-containing protein [Bacteroidales bacterium]|nr:T9SS type A sorting domain-containing protein [Bacteroidales bacterium]
MKTSLFVMIMLSMLMSFTHGNARGNSHQVQSFQPQVEESEILSFKEPPESTRFRLHPGSAPGQSGGNPFLLVDTPLNYSSNVAEATILRYDNSTNVNAIGLQEGGTFTAAIKFPATTMGQFSGMKLSQVEIFIFHVPTTCVLKIWGPGTASSPGTLLHQEQFFPSQASWHVIDIPVLIGITGEELWVGYEIIHTPGLAPSGVGPGPAAAGFGDLFSFDGLEFESLLNSSGLNFNWNIAAILETQSVLPTAYAGEDATICATEQYVIEDATATDFSSVFWTTTGDGYFVTPVSLNPKYVPGPGDIASGSVTLCIDAFPIGGGQPASDCMLLTVDLDPTTCCCPDFKLKDALNICPPEGACRGETAPGLNKEGMAACKETTHTYTVFPNDPGYVYTWTISGGTPTSFVGNPISVLWGSGSSGIIQVFISGNNCNDTISQEICLIDGPQADFTFNPNPVCMNTDVNFFNTSLGGATYFWDFGNGVTHSGANPPPQQYNAAGTYVITLTATDLGSGSAQGDHGACGCVDTISKTIVVLNGQGPEIETDCCYGTVCPGETSSFFTNLVCGTYNWTVAGGTIISGAGTNAITVQWAATYPGPTSVTLAVPGCGSAPCPGSTTIYVPVLYPNLPISGPSPVCVGSSATYSLPVLPGTYYTWTVTGGTYQFNDKDRNVPNVNITFNTPGTYTIQCVYNNPMAGCSGASSITVDVLPVFSILFGPEVVCEGSTETYFSNGNANWFITPPGALVGTGNSPAITWGAPGTYTLVAKPVNPSLFCNDSAVKIVEVIAKPILGPITGKTMVCPDKNQTYSVTSNTVGSQFVWSVSLGTGVIQSEMGADKDSVVVKWTGTGPWQLKVEQEIEISPGNFCTSLPQFLNVNPFPTPTITGVSTVCADAVETYVASGPAPPGGFQWTINPPGQGTIISGQGTNSVNIKWHGPLNNSASVKVEHCSGSFILPIAVNAPPSAVATYSTLPVFCLGDNTTLVLSTPPCGGCSYQWFKAPASPLGTSSNQNINISSLSLGVHQYYVEVTQNGCTMKSNIVDVVIKDCGNGDPGTCDVVAWFWPYVECDKVTLIDKSTVGPGASITLYQWTASGPGTVSFAPNANDPNPVMTVSASGTYVISLTVTSSSGCTHTWTELVNILLPTADFTFTSPTCVDDAVSFTPIPNNPNFNYYWTFGDGFDSYTGLTDHAYSSASPPVFIVNLTITDEYGCVATAQKQVWVNPKTPCVIAASDTAFCPGGYVTLTACDNMNSYQWYKDELPIAGATSQNYLVYQHGEYSVEVTNAFGCKTVAESVYIYMYPTPIANITGETYICSPSWSNAYFYLITPFNPNYSYQWNGPSGNPGDYFVTSTNNDAWGSMPAGTTGQYIFTVTVTDNVTGCKATDYICVTFNLSPDLNVPFYSGCEGPPVTLTPNIIDPSKYTYQWSSGQTTPIITVTAPGSYSLTITDKLTGCSSTVIAAMIFPNPDLSLFPIGCGTMFCNDQLDLYIPLPLNALPWPNTIPDTYPIIEWYDQFNNLVGTGDVLPFIPVTAGSYQFSVVVQNYQGCIDTAGVFCLDVACCLVEIQSVETTPASCPEICDGSITITLDPASYGGPFTITQTSPPPTNSWTIVPGVPLVLTGLCPDFYTFIITDETEHCVEEITVQLGYESDICCEIIIESASITKASCPEVCDGAITVLLDPASTVSPFTITITPPGISYTILPGVPFTLNNLCPGTYLVTITDSTTLCTYTHQVYVGFESDICCDIIIQSTEFTNASCPEICDGSLTIVLDPASTVAPFTITPVAPPGPPVPIVPGVPFTLTGLCPGVYGFVISDETGLCAEEVFFQIGFESDICCDIIIQSTEFTNASCPEICDGSLTIVLDPASTVAPFTITPVAPPGPPVPIVPGVPFTLTGLCPGVYGFVISDETGLCQEEVFFQVGVESDICCDIIVDYVNFTNATCPEICDGSLTIMLDPASTVAPFIITPVAPPGPPVTITPGVPFTLTGLCPGTYGFVITDETGLCAEEVFFQIGVESDICCEIIIEEVILTNASCPETCDGSLSILLDPASTGGPFTITQTSPPPVTTWPIIPGVPFVLSNLCPGEIQFIISNPTGSCIQEVNIYIGFENEDCCFAAIDPSFIHITSPLLITSNTVWDDKYFIADGVMVTVDNGALLDITNVDVVFGECAGIEFVNGGYLRANNSVFRPCDMDKTWKGLRFDDGVLFTDIINMVNECTFKNAEVALYFLKDADALISNNLFSNCNIGIRVEDNRTFNHPISGNRFVTETFYPEFKTACNYPFTASLVSYGIYSTRSDFRQSVSHNEFINGFVSGNVVTYGVHQLFGSGTFSYSTFTDLHYAVALSSQSGYTSIQANRMESKVKGYPINIFQCSGPVIEVHENTLINNYHLYTVSAGIYTNRSARLSISGNEINGFYYGIQALSIKNSQVTNNIIQQSLNTGIYFAEAKNSASFITCNEISMQNLSSTTGIYGVNMSANSEVSSNCVNDCRVSMDFRTASSNPTPLPKIRNNFLYNYNLAGINVQGHTGNIGLPSTDPGMNTLWSNQNAAVDINKSSAPPITVADNFGMFNISFPNVQITSNNPYHSTASCAQQIFNMPSQGNLNINFTCDNYNKIIAMMMGFEGSYLLAQDYLAQFKSSPDPYLDANTIMASIASLDEPMLEMLISEVDLSVNEKSLLRYEYYLRKGNIAKAKLHLQSFIPQDNDQVEFKTLLMLNLDTAELGWEAILPETVEMLKAIADSENVNANLAIYMLNNTSTYRDYLFETVSLENVVLGDQIVQLEGAESYLNIYPNPAISSVVIEAFNANAESSKIEIFDMNGRLVHDYTINFSAAGFELNIEHLKQGIYFVTLSDINTGFLQQGKLVKMSN